MEKSDNNSKGQPIVSPFMEGLEIPNPAEAEHLKTERQLEAILRVTKAKSVIVITFPYEVEANTPVSKFSISSKNIGLGLIPGLLLYLFDVLTGRRPGQFDIK
jgi:hypothetical protein